jgi:hypothetical protein
VGKHYQTKEQKTELVEIFSGVKSASDLDYVACWYLKAVEYMENEVKAAFVSTNSITQGEQVSILWPDLLRRGVKIHFAHRTFQWNSEARGKAAVHCVIVGFGVQDVTDKWLFDYDTPKSEPHAVKASNINPYLVDGPNTVVVKRTAPLCHIPAMRYGNKPTDDGNFILSEDEREILIRKNPRVADFIRPYMGSEDFINGLSRYCLWLKGVAPEELRSMPELLERVEKVRAFRAASSAAPTRKMAETPALFFYISQPATQYLVVPEVSSERRKFIPIGFLSAETICSNTNYLVPDATLYHFGILSSTMHNTWMRAVCGRLKSDYRYSGSFVYNNFPWPEPTGNQRATIETAAQAVLDARAQFPCATLADLYDPLTMPPELVKAHQNLDRAVDAAYGKTSFKTEAERVAFLFERYQQLTAPLMQVEKTEKKGIRKRQN